MNSPTAEIFSSQVMIYPSNHVEKRFHFRLVAPNREIIAQSESYTAKHNVTDILKKYFPEFTVVDLT